jgi:AAA domain
MTAYADPRAAAEEALRTGKKSNGGNGSARPLPRGFSDAELLAEVLPEPIFVVPGLIPEGLTILAGRPKTGKTTLLMNIADACARGGVALGSIECPKIEVLFLALEDNKRRLQRRRNMLLKAEGLEYAPGLHYHLEWPRLDDGGLDQLDRALAGNNAIKLVIIDTWKRICPRRRRDQDDYEHESEAATLLQRLAAKHQVSIVILHHTRKGTSSEDFVDDVLGSTGLTGAVDTVIGFRRKRGTSDAEIYITGRDLDECDRALTGDKTSGKWLLLDGDAKKHRLSRQRETILDLFEKSRRGPKNEARLFTISEIAERIGEPYDNIRVICANMLDDAQLKRVAKAYTLPS